MKRIVMALGALSMLLTLVPSFAVAQEQPAMAKTDLKVGETAPDFSLPSDQGKLIKLSDYRGKKTVILAFYVLAFTGG